MGSKKKYALTSKAWLYPGAKAAWHFLTVPKKESEAIRKDFGAHARGWGSVPVEVTIGKTTWQTSIFPDKKSGTYVLPLKAAVRRKEGIDEGDLVRYAIEIKV